MADENAASLLLRVPLGEPVYGVSMDAAGSSLMTISEKGAGYFERSGKLVWLKTMGPQQRAIHISRDRSTIIVSGNDKVVSCLDQKGAPEWTFLAKGPVWGLSSSFDGALLFAASSDGHLYCLTRDGRLLWDTNIAVPLWSVACSPDGSLISAGGSEGSLFLLDRSGKLLWRQAAGGWMKATAVSEDGSLIVGGSWDDMVSCYSRNGSLLWKHRVGSAVYSLAVHAGTGIVAVASDDGFIYLLGTEGSLLWKTDLGDTVYSVALSGNGLEFAVGTRAGQLLVFSAAAVVAASARMRIKGINSALANYRALNFGVSVQLEDDVRMADNGLIAGSLSEVVGLIGSLADRGKRLAIAAREIMAPLADFRRVVASVRAAGVPEAAVRTVEEGVERAIRDENFTAARELMRAGIQNLGKLRTEVTPVVQLSITGASRFKIEQWGKLDLRFENTGTAAARSMVVTVNAPVEYQAPSDIPFINPGEVLQLGIGLRPMQAGKVPVELVAEYQDAQNKTLRARTSVWIDIEARPDKIAEHITIGAIGTIIGKQVAGDNVEAGGAIIKDSVLNRSTVGGGQGIGIEAEDPKPSAVVSDTVMNRSATPEAPSNRPAFKKCPYCGQEMNLPRTPVFCPYCGERLVA